MKNVFYKIYNCIFLGAGRRLLYRRWRWMQAPAGRLNIRSGPANTTPILVSSLVAKQRRSRLCLRGTWCKVFI